MIGFQSIFAAKEVAVQFLKEAGRQYKGEVDQEMDLVDALDAGNGFISHCAPV